MRYPKDFQQMRIQGCQAPGICEKYGVEPDGRWVEEEEPKQVTGQETDVQPNVLQTSSNQIQNNAQKKTLKKVVPNLHVFHRVFTIIAQCQLHQEAGHWGGSFFGGGTGLGLKATFGGALKATSALQSLQSAAAPGRFWRFVAGLREISGNDNHENNLFYLSSMTCCRFCGNL